MSLQRALLGEITQEMRAIDVSRSDSEILIQFTLETESDARFDEIANEIEAEVEGDFVPQRRVGSEIQIIPTGIPTPLLDFGHICAVRVYQRKELPLRLRASA